MTYEESLMLTGEQWQKLPDTEKVNVLQTIENHMAFEEGRLNCPVEGRFLYTGIDGIVLGTYNNTDRKIYVNVSQFAPDSMYGKDSETLIKTCIHEGRHAYQNQVAEGIIQHNNSAEAALWRENLQSGHYITFHENPRAYYNQPVEVDARNFAEKRYQQLIEERETLVAKEYQSEVKAANMFEHQMQDTAYDHKIAADYKMTDKNGYGW